MRDDEHTSTSIVMVIAMVTAVLLGLAAIVVCAGVGLFFMRASAVQPPPAALPAQPPPPDELVPPQVPPVLVPRESSPVPQPKEPTSGESENQAGKVESAQAEREG